MTGRTSRIAARFGGGRLGRCAKSAFKALILCCRRGAGREPCTKIAPGI